MNSIAYWLLRMVFDSDASLWISTQATPDGQVFRVEKLVPGPIWSIYGIFTYIYHTSQLNVGKYTVSSHGSVIGETMGQKFRWFTEQGQKMGCKNVSETSHLHFSGEKLKLERSGFILMNWPGTPKPLAVKMDGNGGSFQPFPICKGWVHHPIEAFLPWTNGVPDKFQMICSSSHHGVQWKKWNVSPIAYFPFKYYPIFHRTTIMAERRIPPGSWKRSSLFHMMKSSKISSVLGWIDSDFAISW